MLPNESFSGNLQFPDRNLSLSNKKNLVFEPGNLSYSQTVLPQAQTSESLPTLKQLTHQEDLNYAMIFPWTSQAGSLIPEEGTPGDLLWIATRCPDFKSRVDLIEKAYFLATSQKDQLEAVEIASLARQALHKLWENNLANDVSLTFESQDSHSYQVSKESGDRLLIGKHRSQFQIFFVKKVFPSLNRNISDAHVLAVWLTWLVVGLLPAGLLTLVLAPWAIFNFGKLWWGLRNQSKTRTTDTFESKLAYHMASVGLKWSLTCWFVSILLFLLLVSHLLV